MSETTAASPVRILIAEDDADHRFLTVRALRDLRGIDLEIDTVADGAEALDYVHGRGPFTDRQLPHLLLLDIKMPKVDGIEVLRQVKSDRTLKHIPVVVLTSSREEQDVVRSYDLGVNAYVVKPVDFAEFMDAVKLLGGFWAVVNEPPPAC